MHEDGEMTSMSTQTFWQLLIKPGRSAIKHISLPLGVPEKIGILGLWIAGVIL